MSDQQCPLGNFARVRKVMMATTATMSVVIVVQFLLRVIIIEKKEEGDWETEYRLLRYIDYLNYMRFVVWIAYLVYMSGVLNRLPNGEGYKVLGAELGRIAAGAIVALINLGEIAALINLIGFAYVFFVFKKSEVKDPQELLTACQGCRAHPYRFLRAPRNRKGRWSSISI